jgi:nondiscriminating glutamyl-tRNA synthetase
MNRYRFAPSPTGPLHVGNVRTALFNWLSARHDGGVFVLRIEDTDRERSTVEFEEGLFDDLRWLGLAWDEGALPGGRERGEHGPYRQSRRLAIYAAAAERLAQRGLTYPCFCAEEDLTARRQAALAAGRPPQYDGRCGRLAPEERARRVAAGEPHALRFRVPERAVGFVDDVRGEVTFGPGTLGDFILRRADGFPTYNFACVVDDAAMRITHVIRGEDHLSNTVRQLLLYQALGEPPPRFSHVALILGADRSKLSKRDGETDLRGYRERGYLPRAMLNHVALLGWSAADGREVLSPAELIAAFDPARISKSAAVFDPAKLEWIGIQQMKAAPLAEAIEVARPFVAVAGVGWEGPVLEQGIALLREGLSCGADFARELAIFRAGPVSIDAAERAYMSGAARAGLLGRVADGLAALEAWQAPKIAETMRAIGRAAGVSGKDLFMPVRVAVTGRGEGPALAETIELLGRDETLRRLRAIREEAG